MDIKSIAEHNKLNASQVIGMYIKEAWYFEKWYEKLILVGLGILGLWKLVGFIF